MQNQRRIDQVFSPSFSPLPNEHSTFSVTGCAIRVTTHSFRLIDGRASRSSSSINIPHCTPASFSRTISFGLSFFPLSASRNLPCARARNNFYFSSSSPASPMHTSGRAERSSRFPPPRQTLFPLGAIFTIMSERFERPGSSLKRRTSSRYRAILGADEKKSFDPRPSRCVGPLFTIARHATSRRRDFPMAIDLFLNGTTGIRNL